MDFKVRMRLNKTTGQVELFEVVDAGGTRLSPAEHDDLHDQIAHDLASAIEIDPEVRETLPGVPWPPDDIGILPEPLPRPREDGETVR
jgi:hypothetical protein